MALCVNAGTVAETSTSSSACSSAAIGHTAPSDSTNVNVVRLPQSNIFSDSVLNCIFKDTSDCKIDVHVTVNPSCK